MYVYVYMYIYIIFITYNKMCVYVCVCLCVYAQKAYDIFIILLQSNKYLSNIRYQCKDLDESKSVMSKHLPVVLGPFIKICSSCH